MARYEWTIPTAISLSRIVLVGQIGYCFFTEFPGHRTWAASLMLLAAFTDVLDGYLARSLHQVSELGKIVDPLADKVSVAAVAVMLVWLGDLPLWYFIVVVIRDFVIMAGGIYIKAKKQIIVQSNYPGKAAVLSVAFYLLFSALKNPEFETIRLILMWTSLALMAFSLGLYSQRLLIGRNIARKVD